MANAILARLTSSQAIAAAVVALLALASQVKDILAPITPAGFEPYVLPALLTISVLLILHAFLFAQPTRSRLVRPEALRLQRDNQQHLVGRQEEIDRVIALAASSPLLFIEGESGVGKSALLGAGVARKLAAGGAMLPVYIQTLAGPDWDEDAWRLLFLAIQQSVTADEKRAAGLGGLPPPGERQQILASLQTATARTPLIIVDQFDDYQARHWAKFQDGGSWIKAADVIRDNSFWRALAELTQQGKVHLAIVTRRDTALGLESVRFAEPATFTVPRLEKHFIGQLMNSIAQSGADAGAAVIENPEAGWTALRDRLVDDLGRTGAVLPQQLKIALLGLATLPRQVLSVSAYERAGGVNGLEAGWIGARIKRAAEAGGLSEERTLKVLLALIDPEEPRKTRDLSVEALAATTGIEAGDRRAIEVSLAELESEEVVRQRRDPGDEVSRWRLDHDYLTGVVREAERRANIWVAQLKEGQDALAASRGHPLRQWKALMRPGVQFKFFWNRIRGRFRYGALRAYALQSTLRFLPAVLVPLAALAGYQYYNDRMERQNFAEYIIRPFDDEADLKRPEVDAVLELQQQSRQRARDVLDKWLSSETLIGRLDAHADRLARAMAWQTEDPGRVGSRLIAAMDRFAAKPEMLASLGRIAARAGSGLSAEQSAEIARRLPPAARSAIDPATGPTLPSIRMESNLDNMSQVGSALIRLGGPAKPIESAIWSVINSSPDEAKDVRRLVAMIVQQIPNSRAAPLRGPLEAMLDREVDPKTAAGLSILKMGLDGSLPPDRQIASLFQTLSDPLASGMTGILLFRLGELARRPMADERSAYLWLAAQQKQGQLQSIDLDSIAMRSRQRAAARLTTMRGSLQTARDAY